MIKFYFTFSRKILFLLTVASLGIPGFSAYAGDPADTVRLKQSRSDGKLTDTRTNKPSVLNTGVKLNFTPYKPAVLRPVPAAPQTAPPAAKTPSPAAFTDKADNKLLTVTKIYPNPVDDQVNISYHLNKSATVTIKLMDVLGSELSVLMTQKVGAGDQVFSYNFSNKLNSGIYFIHVIAGNELNVKRISVL